MVTNRQSSQPYRKLHRGVLLLQRRLRALRAQVEFPLDPISAIIVMWIGDKPLLQFGELQKFLRLPKANLSRLMSSLIDLGYLSSRISDSDSRKKQFVYTQKGRKLLAELNTINNRLVRVGIYPLTATQIALITAAFEAIASGLGAPFEPERKGEEPLFGQIRRLSRVSGMVGSNYLDIGHDIMTYHIISELGWKQHAVPLRFFLKTLQVPRSSLSRDISQLVARGWIQREQARHDRKVILLRLTEKGRRHFESCEESIGSSYKRALVDVPIPTIEEWSELLHTLEGLEHPDFQAAPIFAERCESEASLRKVRGFIVEELVRTQRHFSLPNQILPQGQLCISVREADTIIGVAFAPESQPANAAAFSAVFLSQDVSTPHLAHEVFSKAAECLRGAPLPVQIMETPPDSPHLSNLTLGGELLPQIPIMQGANPLAPMA